MVYNAVQILFILFSTKAGHACLDFQHFSKQRNLRGRIGLLLLHLQWSRFRESSTHMKNNLEVMLHIMVFMYRALGALDYQLLNSKIFSYHHSSSLLVGSFLLFYCRIFLSLLPIFFCSLISWPWSNLAIVPISKFKQANFKQPRNGLQALMGTQIII